MLEAAASKLPQKVPDATPTYPVDRTRLQGRLRVHCENLEAVHLFHLHRWLHPARCGALGMRRSNTDNLLMKAFSDDVGPGPSGNCEAP